MAATRAPKARLELHRISRQLDANAYLSALQRGRARLVCEHRNGRQELLVVPSAGEAPTAIVGRAHEKRFQQFLVENGRDDGLFPGFAQTASISNQ